MKTIIFYLLYAMMLTSLLIMSCSEDPLDTASSGTESLALLQELQSSAEGQAERVTLDELNAILAEHGMEKVTQTQIDDVNERRRVYRAANPKKFEKSFNCYTPFADWSRQQNRQWCNYNPAQVSVLDVVLAQNYINAFGNGSSTSAPSGHYWIGYPDCASENFGTISYFELGTLPYTVDQDDKAIVIASILGTCP